MITELDEEMFNDFVKTVKGTSHISFNRLDEAQNEFDKIKPDPSVKIPRFSELSKKIREAIFNEAERQLKEEGWINENETD